MSPCSPTDVSFPIPSGPSGPPIPGFGTPFSLKTPNINPFPDGFPEDLLGLLDKLQLLIPPGALKPALNPNFGKNVFDAIMKLLDQFFPFLMLYKFFLPILNLIICIIEVLCSLMNPFKLISALNRLFTQCIPEFLNLFPVFALVIMIISLLLLLLALIEYLITQILNFVKDILLNVNALIKAFETANDTSVLAIAKKLGSLLCSFQNFFVLLSLFGTVIQVFKDILSKLFAIPPCEDDANSGCCSTDVCPAIVKQEYTNTTGTFQYLNEVGYQTSLILPIGNFNVDLRNETWQIYDTQQTIAKAFINIVDGYDVTVVPKPIFFPTDVNYNASTNPKQAAYTVDLRLYYNPINWGRIGISRFIQFKDCIVLAPPTRNLKVYDNSFINENNGVLYIVGGSGYEDDGFTILTGFNIDGITPITNQATLSNLLHKPAEFASNPTLSPSDGYTFQQMQYTFKPNMQVLFQKNLVTLGCEQSFSFNKSFINNVAFGDIALKTADLTALVNSNGFPNPGAAQACMATAISGLRSNLTANGVAEFQATTTLCLQILQSDTKSALATLVGIGFSPCKSNFTLLPSTQFTTKSIKVTVNINENNGLPITTGLSSDIAQNIANQITPYITFGKITNFSYDGYQAFTADISSPIPGSGNIMVAYNNNTLCTDTLPADGSTPTHTLQDLKYEFVYTPSITGTGERDTDGQPRRDLGDISKDGA